MLVSSSSRQSTGDGVVQLPFRVKGDEWVAGVMAMLVPDEADHTQIEILADCAVNKFLLGELCKEN